jgi:hypothetical protein
LNNGDNSNCSSLPDHEYIACSNPTFLWDSLPSSSFITAVDNAYAEAVHRRRNIFKVPSGFAGKSFVSELSHLFNAYADASALECIALKAAMHAYASPSETISILKS